MKPRTNRNAFTLVEILIVVVILGILAATVIPSFANARDETEQGAFVTSLRQMVEAVRLFRVREGMFPNDASSGELPDGFAEYVSEADWTKPTPIGGVWDTEFQSFDVVSAVGVHFNGDTPKSTDYMLVIDQIIDDGDLEAGAFRQLAEDRFYYVLEDE